MPSLTQSGLIFCSMTSRVNRPVDLFSSDQKESDWPAKIVAFSCPANDEYIVAMQSFEISFALCLGN